MTRKSITIYGLVCALLGAIVTLAIGVLTYHPTTEKETVKTEIRRDTVTNIVAVHDTITVEKLKPIYSEVVKYDTIKRDTVLITERMAYDVEVCNDSISGAVRAVVSGVNPSLDSLTYRFHIPTKTITSTVEVEKIVTKKTHISYGVGVMAGYGFFGKRPEIVGGVYIGYSF